jgi:hypothetical protein
MARLVLDVAYHRAYRLNEGIDVNNPLNPVLVRPKVIHTEDPLYTFSRHFMKSKVGEYFHISFIEFMRLPPYLCEYLLDLATKRTEADGQAVGSQVDKLKALERGKP